MALARRAASIPQSSPRTKATSHWLLGELAELVGNDSEAATANEQALAAAMEEQDPRLEFLVAQQATRFAIRQGDTVKATDFLAGFETLRGDPSLQRDLGALLMERGDTAGARQHLETALSLFQEQENARGAASCLVRLGLVALRVGNPGEAKTLYSNALSLSERLDDLEMQASAHSLLGAVSQILGAYDEAQSHLEQALSMARALGLRSLMVTDLQVLEQLAQERGVPADAMRWREELLALQADEGLSS